MTNQIEQIEQYTEKTKGWSHQRRQRTEAGVAKEINMTKQMNAAERVFGNEDLRKVILDFKSIHYQKVYAKHVYIPWESIDGVKFISNLKWSIVINDKDIDDAKIRRNLIMARIRLQRKIGIENIDANLFS